MNSLAFKNVGALIVSSDGNKVNGIISERDIVRGLQSVGPDLLSKQVGSLMTEKVITCVAEDRAASIMAVMVSRHLRHIPVVKDDKFVDIVSIRDLLQLRLDEVRSEAEAMQSYISGDALSGSAERVSLQATSYVQEDALVIEAKVGQII